MRILVLNSGSSSIKYRLLHGEDWSTLARGSVTRIGEAIGESQLTWRTSNEQEQSQVINLIISNHQDGIAHLISKLYEYKIILDINDLCVIGHRVVHGGPDFKEPVLITDKIEAEIRALIPLAPLHNPGHLAGIQAARQIFPQIPSVAVFDTAFHQTMPEVAYRYALPEFLYLQQRIRRYGFHGTSHQYIAQRAALLLDKPLNNCNFITLHWGNGASICAIRNGQSIDTSMGFTPLEGLVMGTRCGDLDPAVPSYLAQHLQLDQDEIDDLLNRRSGLLGLCGMNDMREIEQRAVFGDARAELALAITIYRIQKYIGAYYVQLEHLDALIFTGGIGEHSSTLRQRVCEKLKCLGILLNQTLNNNYNHNYFYNEQVIHSENSTVKILIIPTDEELAIAQQAFKIINLNN